MALLERLRLHKEAESVDPREYGFVVLEATVPVGDAQVVAYLKYLDTGGTPVQAWEKILKRLDRAGRLEHITKAYEQSRHKAASAD